MNLGFFLRKAETHSLPAAFILRSYTFIIVLPLFTVVAPSFWFESCCYIYIYLKCYLTIFFCFKLSQPLLLCIVLFIVLLPLQCFLLLLLMQRTFGVATALAAEPPPPVEEVSIAESLPLPPASLSLGG